MKAVVAFKTVWAAAAVCAVLFLVVSLVVTVGTSQRIADCTTPGGECYDRGREATADAVKKIIDGVDLLQQQRGQTAVDLNKGQQQIREAVKQLCLAQRLSCPSVQ